MPTSPLSIVACCHNDKAAIGAAVKSILFQCYPDFELPVISEASDDGTVDEIGACPDPRIRPITREHHEENAAALIKVEPCSRSLVARSFPERKQRHIVSNIATRPSFNKMWRLPKHFSQPAFGLRETLASRRLTFRKPYCY